MHNRQRQITIPHLKLFAYWVTFHAFLSSADFFKINFRKILSGIPSVSNNLDPDHARHFVGPDLGPNCLQRLSADDTSRQRVKNFICRWDQKNGNKRIFHRFIHQDVAVYFIQHWFLVCFIQLKMANISLFTFHWIYSVVKKG